MLSVTMEQVERALQALKDGKVIIFPTETSYGIGCDAGNEEAVKKIFEIKGRDDLKALPIIIPDFDSAKKYIKMPPVALALAEEFWPGGLNIISELQPDAGIAPGCSSNGTQSVRVSSHPFSGTLAKRFGKPIVATSANISGRDAIFEVEEIRKVFEDKGDLLDVFIDGGDLPILPMSTTVKVLDNDHVEIVRDGIIRIPKRYLKDE